MTSKRIHWIDWLRGFAILLMAVYHFAFDLDLLEIQSIDFDAPFWAIFANTIRFSFFVVIGLSLYLSHKKPHFLKRQIIRAIKLFMVAMGVTGVTWIFYPESFIQFGVLHFISIAIILSALLIRYPRFLFGAMFISLILGSVFTQIRLGTTSLLPIGIAPKAYHTLDYFPIFPWLAVVFFGILLAYVLDYYKLLKNPERPIRLKLLEKAGQKSLLIYLVHQPVLLGILWLFT